MDLSKDTQEKIEQLQLFEQKMHSFLTQKQTFQAQLLETENALKELENAKGDVYKIVGNVMVKKDTEELKKSLKEREELIGLRLKSIEKQEIAVKEQAEKIQAEVMAEFEKKKAE